MLVTLTLLVCCLISSCHAGLCHPNDCRNGKCVEIPEHNTAICECDAGFKTDLRHRFTCTDIDECKEKTCGHEFKETVDGFRLVLLGYCVNTPGSWHCECTGTNKAEADLKSCVPKRR